MSSTNNYSIIPILEPDLPALAALVQESKLPLTINRLLYKDWPNEAAQRAQCIKTVENNFKNPDSERFKVVENETGVIVGHVVLFRKTPSKAKATTGKEKRKPEVPDGMNEEIFRAVVEAVGTIDTGKDVDHMELTHIFVKPNHCHKGLGTKLVQLAIQKAKEAGVPLVVQAEAPAHDFFLHRGFEDKKYAEIDLTRWAPKHSGFGVFRLTGMVIANEKSRK